MTKQRVETVSNLLLVSGGGELHLDSSDLLDDAGLSLLAAQLALSEVLVASGGLDGVANDLVLDISGGLLLEDRVGADGGVSRLVHLLNLIARQTSLDGLAELALVGLGVLSLQVLHVAAHVLTHNALLVNLGVVLAVLALARVAGESLDGVGDVNAAVAGTLEGTEQSGTNSGSVQTAVQHSLEGSSLALEVIGDVELVTSGLLLANKGSVQADLLKQTSSQEQTSAVSSGVVLQTDSNTISGQLSRESLSQNSVALDGRVDDLANDLRVSSADNETVLVGVVLVLILLDESSALSVVSLILSSASVLGLEALVVSVGLDSLDESHIQKLSRGRKNLSACVILYNDLLA